MRRGTSASIGIWARRAAMYAAALTLAACHRTTSTIETNSAIPSVNGTASTPASAPHASPASTIASSPTSAAATGVPPDFPDLSRFAQVPIAQYLNIPSRNTKVVYFRPPSKKFNCAFAYKAEPGVTTGITCGGVIPGAPPPSSGNGDCVSSRVSAGYGNFSPKTSRIECRPETQSEQMVRVLQPGTKIVNGGVTCAEGEDDFTACLTTAVGTGTHGFVITQQKTWSF